MSLGPELSAAILWTTKGLMCLYIVLIAVMDVDQWGYYMHNDASKLVFVGFVITAFFADTGLFLLASMAFILTLVRLESSSMKPNAESEKFGDVMTASPPAGYEYVAEGSNRNKEGFIGNVPTSASAATPTSAPTSAATPTPTETVVPTSTPITPSTLVSKEKTTDVTGKSLDDPAQQALQKYTIETSLEKASSDGIIKSNYNKFMYPLSGQQYNVQGITETIVGYNYDHIL